MVRTTFPPPGDGLEHAGAVTSGGGINLQSRVALGGGACAASLALVKRAYLQARRGR